MPVSVHRAQPKHLPDLTHSLSSYDWSDPCFASVHVPVYRMQPKHLPDLTVCSAVTWIWSLLCFSACSSLPQPKHLLDSQSIQLWPWSDPCYASVHVPVYHTQPKHLPDLTHTVSLFSCDLGLILAMLQCMFQFARAQAPPWHIVQPWPWLVLAMLQCLFQATAVQVPPWPDS